MNLWALVKRTITFYRRANIGLLLTVVVSSAVLTGALAIGDSIHHSLMMIVKARLGTADFALIARNRFFRTALANDLATRLNVTVAPVLDIKGIIANSDGTKRANQVEVRGVDDRFYEVGPGGNPLQAGSEAGVLLNEPLAKRLNIKPGDQVVLRIEKPGLMPRDLPLTPDTDLATAFRLDVLKVVGDDEFGRFSLQANQIAPLSVFVPLSWLQAKIERQGQANIVLVSNNSDKTVTVEEVDKAVKECWGLADAELELRRLDNLGVFELRSSRVFIDESVSRAALEAADGSRGIFTYFVNELRFGDKATPFSMVAGLEHSKDDRGLIPAGMKDDEIVINEWTASDLGVKAGDSIELVYFVLSPMRKLVEAKKSFRVRSIVPIVGAALDPNLMPNFPGMADAENCREWDSGIPINFDKIRQKDEDYWDKYRGTPKGFVTLKAGRSMWANRYGDLTAVRYPGGVDSEDNIVRKILSNVDPASVGLFFQPVRQSGLKAGGGATDFTQLFVSLSFFLVIAAALLTGLVFVFGVESRAEQIGMLKALGFGPRLLKRLYLTEGAILSVVGAAVGAGIGLLYAKSMIYGLVTIWRDALAGTQISFYVKPLTWFLGPFIAVIVSLGAMWITLRKHVSRPARELLAGQLKWQFLNLPRASGRKIGLWLAVLAAGGAVVMLAVLGGGDSASVSGAFFGAGALLLLAGLAFTHAIITRLKSGAGKSLVSLAGLGLRNSTRRSGRSLAVVALLACGIFLTMAIGVFRSSPNSQSQKRDSGTGGFALYGESSLGILHDLNSEATRKSMGFDQNILKQASVVQMRVRDGDDASCFNLNRAQTPRLLGVDSQQLQKRGAFAFVQAIESASVKDAWSLLDLDMGRDVVPALGDYATVYWGLGKSVGDEVQFSDEKGRPFRVRIVGMIGNSIMQGSLLISEDQFVRRFPSEDGYRLLLIDAPVEQADKVANEFSLRMMDYGLSISSTRDRLAGFGAIQNTYLSMFQTLGGLALILGSIGLGLVVLRNILERRGELAMMQAVGFDKTTLKKMVFYEHWGLMLAGLVCGLICAAVAVSPALKSPGSDVPYLSLAATTVIIAGSGMLWIWLASTLALSGRMIDSLRNE